MSTDKEAAPDGREAVIDRITVERLNKGGWTITAERWQALNPYHWTTGRDEVASFVTSIESAGLTIVPAADPEKDRIVDSIARQVNLWVSDESYQSIRARVVEGWNAALQQHEGEGSDE